MRSSAPQKEVKSEEDDDDEGRQRREKRAEFFFWFLSTGRILVKTRFHIYQLGLAAGIGWKYIHITALGIYLPQKIVSLSSLTCYRCYRKEKDYPTHHMYISLIALDDQFKYILTLHLPSLAHSSSSTKG